MVLKTKLREWYPFESNNPSACYVAYFVHIGRNSLHSHQKKPVKDGLAKLLKEVANDTQIPPEHQIHFGAILSRFMADPSYKGWKSKTNFDVYQTGLIKAYEHAEKRIKESIGNF